MPEQKADVLKYAEVVGGDKQNIVHSMTVSEGATIVFHRHFQAMPI